MDAGLAKLPRLLVRQTAQLLLCSPALLYKYVPNDLQMNSIASNPEVGIGERFFFFFKNCGIKNLCVKCIKSPNFSAFEFRRVAGLS